MPWDTEQIRTRYEQMVAIASDTPDRLRSEPFHTLTAGKTGTAGTLTVYLSEPFVKAVRKARLVSSATLWKTLRNLQYGYDPKLAMSPGGRDGIFAVSADFKTRNEMVRKLYDRFFDKPGGQALLAHYFPDPTAAQGVRVVSHGLRLLGFVAGDTSSGWKLVLIDLDVNQR